MERLVSFLRQPHVLIAAAIAVADQATKAIVVRDLPLHQSVTVIPGLLDFTHVRNTGAAFGLLNAVDFPYKPLVITGVALIALIAIAVYANRFGTDTAMTRIALGLVLGGAIGNLIDRAGQGYVVDFVDFYWRGWHFWAFNVADAAITVGAILLILDLLGAGTRVPKTV
jgi:signal peptidase II